MSMWQLILQSAMVAYKWIKNLIVQSIILGAPKTK